MPSTFDIRVLYLGLKYLAKVARTIIIGVSYGLGLTLILLR